MPSKRVNPAMPGTWSQPLVTGGRLVIACASAGKFVCSAASSCVCETLSVFSRKPSRPGSSAVTDESGIVCSSAVVCGKFFCSAARTAACESPVFCETNAISFGTSATAAPLRGHDRILRVDDRGDHRDPGAVAVDARGGVDRAQRVEQLLSVADARDEREGEHERDHADADDEHDRRARDGRPARDAAPAGCSAIISEREQDHDEPDDEQQRRDPVDGRGPVEAVEVALLGLEHGDQVRAEVRPQLRHALDGRAVEARQPVDALDVVPAARHRRQVGDRLREPGEARLSSRRAAGPARR